MRDEQRAVRVVRPRRLAAALLSAATVAAGTGLLPACAADRGAAHPPVVGIVDTGLDPRGLEAVVVGDVPPDLDGHGTEMAWIVHAAAPSARLVAVRAFADDGTIDDARIAAAIGRARRDGASVVLVSLAGAEPLPRTRRAIAAAGTDGVLVVVAAGNDGLDLDRSPAYPAAYRLANLVTVAAARPDGRLWGSSNRGGPTAVAAAAAVPTCTSEGERATSVGTSAAAAMTAGVAAREGWDAGDLRARPGPLPAPPAPECARP